MTDTFVNDKKEANVNTELSLPVRVSQFFAEKGVLSKSLPRYEFREEQLQMSLSVAEAIEGKRLLMVEAGTGVGKSLAYLVPAILKAVHEEQRVFVATGTKTLQHQLMEKELPFLKRHLGVSFSYALCVGSENYLCERRLAAAALPGQEGLFPKENELQALEEWVERSPHGLRSELDFPLSNSAWYQVCRVPELCAGQDCGKCGDCFYQRARNRMIRSEVLVGNHHILFANLMSGWEYLPECRILVVDEAHNLDNNASECLGIEFSQRAFHRVWEGLRGVEGRNCLIGSLLEIPIEQRLGLLEQIRETERRFLETMKWFHDQVLQGQQRLAVSHETARRGLEHFLEPLSQTVAALKLLTRKLDREELKVECEGYTSRLERALMDARKIVEMDEGDPWLLWCEAILLRGKTHPDGYPTAAFHATPIDPGEILRESLYPNFQATILVSATLSTGGKFGYIQSRLGADDSETLSLQSPFDYRNNLLVYSPSDLPEPARFEEYTSSVTHQIVELVSLAEGGTFVLCTSYKTLNALYELFRIQVPSVDYQTAVRERSSRGKHRFLVLRQGETSREKLLDVFKKAGKAVLFAASTFWQGVDVPGQALEMVIITRLPFQMPEDPILEAKVRLCKERGGDPFNQIQVPYAVMQFRQGIGRLIRSKTDRGVVAILDSRVVTKRYGREFLSAIPECLVTDSIEHVKAFLTTKTAP